MRLLVKEVMFLCVVGLGLVLPACAQDDPNNLGCLVETELPPFGSVNRVREAVDVDVEVTVGDRGLPSAFVLTPQPPRDLAFEIEYFLRSRTVYDPKCSGKKVKLRYSFRVEGGPKYVAFRTYWFRPPNHFTIFTQPPKPSITVMPLPPPDPEKGQPKP